MSVISPLPSWLNNIAMNFADKNSFAENSSAGNSLIENSLTNFRRQHCDAFLKNGLPTRKNEYWKYDDVAFLNKKNFVDASKPDENHLLKNTILKNLIAEKRLQESILLVSVNGYFIPAFSDIEKINKLSQEISQEIIICSINQAAEQHSSLLNFINSKTVDAKKYPLACLNAAMFTDGLFLKIPDHCKLNLPIHLLAIALDDENHADNEWISHARNEFIFGNNAEVTLFEENISLTQQTYFINKTTTIHVGEEAQLTHYKLQNENKNSIHAAYTAIQQKKNSNVSFVNLSHGAMFARDDLIIQLQETGTSCSTHGFYHLRHDNQCIDNHVDIQHAAAHSNSEMLFKGIVDKHARAIFNGRLLVEKNAQKILAYQANHNILLSREAEVYSKPELEIYADDVKCKHGATTGQLDQDALFYLRSRGISHEEAVNILLQGFSGEIMQRITHPEIKKRAEEML